MILADISKASGGDDTALNPHELLEASLGACTNMTVMLYAQRKGWDLTDVHTRIKIVSESQDNVILREINFIGNLTDEQRVRLLTIADKCPMHKFLERKTIIETKIL